MPNWLQCDRCNHWVRDFAVACDGCGHRFPKVCRHFLKNRCRYENSCRFRHAYEVGTQVEGYPKPIPLPETSLTTVGELPYLPDPLNALGDVHRINLVGMNRLVVPLSDGPVHGSNVPPYTDWGTYMCLSMRGDLDWLRNHPQDQPPVVNTAFHRPGEGPPPPKRVRIHCKQPSPQ